VNAGDVQTGWLHQQSLDGVTEISVECDQVDLAFEADDTLGGTLQMIGEPAENLPVIRQSGSAITIRQTGRYRGKVRPLVRVPAADCPTTVVTLGKGELAFQGINADVAIKLGLGDVDVRNGAGALAVSLGKGDVSVARRLGNVAVKIGMGDTSIAGCSGLLAINLGKGDVRVSDPATNVEIRTGNGDINVRRPLGGSLSINSGRGDVSIDGGESGSVAVRTGKGDLRSSVRLLANVDQEGDDEPESYEDFDDFEPTDTFSLGDLEIEANDDGVRIGRGSRNIVRLGPEGIQIRGSNREISLGPEGIRVGGPHTDESGNERFVFDTGRGDVHVDLPSDLNVRVEVLATGDVKSDVPLVSVARPGPRGTMKRLVGVADGTGTGPRANIRVRTRRGDVSLHSVRVQPRVATPEQPTEEAAGRDEQARVILEALSRGDLSINEADRLLERLDRDS
jgi:hypothetical protein